MSTFSYNDWSNSVASKPSNGGKSFAKIGFFGKDANGNKRMSKDGDEAVVRINLSSVNELHMVSVHPAVYGSRYEGLSSFSPVSCLRGADGKGECPFCKAAAEGHAVVSKATSKVYVPMLIAYRDVATGGWTEAQPVVWERPAGFARELATMLKDYGPLKNIVLKIARVGVGTDTRYTFAFIPTLDKPELVPTDFSAFNNFDFAKHSYYEKSAEDMNRYLTEGTFPEVIKTEAPAVNTTAAASTTQAPDPTPYVAPTPAPTPAPAPVSAPSGFGGFSF